MSDGGQNHDTDVKQGLLAAYRRFMAPLVRILIRNGISFNEFADELRGVYVDVAASDFPIEGRSPSGTRVAILTGLTRKEVKRQLERSTGLSSESLPSDVNRVTRVLDGWHKDPDFTGPYSLPLEVYFDRPNGETPSFTELVRRHSGDMSARAMLDELLRIDAVEQLPDGELRVLTQGYISALLDPAVLERMGTVIGNLAETLDHNFFSEGDDTNKRFERNVFSQSGISEEALQEFSELVKEKGQLFLETLNHFLTANEIETDNLNNKKITVKTGVEIYHYVETK